MRIAVSLSSTRPASVKFDRYHRGEPPRLVPEALSGSATHELLLASQEGILRASGSLRLDRDVDSGPVAGAIPFSADDEAELFRPTSIVSGRGGLEVPAESGLSSEIQLVPVPTREEYTQRVSQVVERLRSGQGSASSLCKVVLARRLDVVQEESINVEWLAARLGRDPNVTTFLLRMFSEGGVSHRALIGASPELLIEKRGRGICSAPLAGSARRSPDPEMDRTAATQLLDSGKDREEHRLVVEYVLDTLAPFCDDISAPEAPSLAHTDTMWHLVTRIEGRLKDADMPSLALARQLHPTPAVCGVPSDESQRLIETLEPFSRGLYGGAVGLSDASGDGTWMVALRCAEVAGQTASLFAGAGILPESDPAAECDETSDKFRALLSAFGASEEIVDGPETKAI